MTEIHIPSLAGHKIPATLNGEPEEVLCILCHGIFVDRNENGRFERLAQRLADGGIASLRVDLSGHGSSEVPSVDASVTTMSSEISDAVRFAVTSYPKAKICLVLSSFSGALFSLSNTVLDHSGVNKFVFLNPVLDFEDVFVNPSKDEMSELFSARNIEECLNTGSFSPVPHFTMSRSFYLELAAINVARLYSQFNFEHLVIHGDADELVDYENTKRICETNASCHFETIPNAAHAFTDASHEMIAHRLLIDWIEK